MNALDFCLFITLASFVLLSRNRSFVYYLLGSIGFFGGYLLGVALAPAVTKNFSSDTKKGFVALALMVGLSGLLGLAGLFIGKKVKMRLIQSRLFTVDRLLFWPYKLVVSFVIILILSQTLIYVPILGLQFEAQGSAVLMTADRLMPSTAIEGLAQKISPEQFKKLQLDYDPNPLTYNNIADAGEFQAVLDNVAASVVKISGRNCVGLHSGSGFIVAPGYVVTNAHVVGGASSVYISDHEGVYPATPIVIDSDYDIAVLYSKFLQTPPIFLATDDVTADIPAITVGYPGGGDLRMAKGMTTTKAHKSAHNKLDESNTLTLNASLGPGSSGGPVFNLEGEVIGVNDAGSGGELIAIKTEIVSKIVEKAKRKLIPTNTEFCGVPPKFY